MKKIYFFKYLWLIILVDIKSKRINWFINLNQSLDVNPNNMFNGSQIVNSGGKIITSSNQFLYIIDSDTGSYIEKKFSNFDQSFNN